MPSHTTNEKKGNGLSKSDDENYTDNVRTYPRTRLQPLLSLEYLVSTLTTFEATLPHDTIYALLAIAKDTTAPVMMTHARFVSGTVGTSHEDNETYMPRPSYNVDYKLPSQRVEGLKLIILKKIIADFKTWCVEERKKAWLITKNGIEAEMGQRNENPKTSPSRMGKEMDAHLNRLADQATEVRTSRKRKRVQLQPVTHMPGISFDTSVPEGGVDSGVLKEASAVLKKKSLLDWWEIEYALVASRHWKQKVRKSKEAREEKWRLQRLENCRALKNKNVTKGSGNADSVPMAEDTAVGEGATRNEDGVSTEHLTEGPTGQDETTVTDAENDNGVRSGNEEHDQAMGDEKPDSGDHETRDDHLKDYDILLVDARSSNSAIPDAHAPTKIRPSWHRKIERTRLTVDEAEEYDHKVKKNLRERLGEEGYYSYTLLGECYIHGTMDGEAMRHRNGSAEGVLPSMADWKVHKLICKSFSEHMNNRPSQKHYSIIVFPKDEEAPRFEWTLFEPGTYNAKIPSPKKAYVQELGFEFYGVNCNNRNNPIGYFEEDSTDYTTKRHIAGKHLGLLFTRNLGSFEEPLPEDIPINKSLMDIDPELARLHGKGHVLAWGCHCPEDRRKTSDLNCTPADFRHAVDALRKNHYKDSLRAKEVISRKTGGVLAVRLTCVGDKLFFGHPTYESQIEPRSILSKDSQVPCPVADKVGIPLIIRKEPPALSWRDRDFESRRENHNAAMLNPPTQKTKTGTLIIARKDGKPLLPTHLFCLIIYTGERLQDPQFGEDGPRLPSMMLQSRLNLVSPEDFEEYYNNEWHRLKLSERFVPSPFQMYDDYDGEIHPINMR
ncbi:hypothetical protein J4E93_008766 [Alternaria ventricosa]|uniref:uncharacterized protein n=1 Tax=Alternaria ventricosa TaxID=1187951 RepID=UPI0020C52FB0|nr:uncharacterized protein J4E93_008766 [Alternaria ventricosa]KAI4639967.1 hypothetical protein J4E93_008766 [Alternaria ventricosa]